MTRFKKLTRKQNSSNIRDVFFEHAKYPMRRRWQGLGRKMLRNGRKEISMKNTKFGRWYIRKGYPTFG